MLVLLIGIGLVAGFLYLTHRDNALSKIDQTPPTTFSKIVTALAGVIKADLEMDDGRINFLLTGIGGAEHDGALLTDTMMLLSIKPKTGEVAMISIPRDLVVPISGYGFRKINMVNAVAEANEKNSGGEYTRAFVEKLLAIRIPYYVRIDFDGFKKAVDRLGGITVMVDRSFQDEAYPTDNYLTQTVSFEKGVEKMSGARALQYVRSRHGNNGEGSDFARSKRQQKVLSALKNQILNTNLLFDPKQIRDLYKILTNHIDTSLEIGQIINLAKTTQAVAWGEIYTYVLDDRPTGPLYASTETGSYLLLPKKEDCSDLRFIAKNLFNQDKLNNFFDTALAKLEIQNGTTIPNWATTKSSDLRIAGFEIIKISNAKTNDFNETFIYDLSTNKSEALKKLKAQLPKSYIVEINRDRAKEVFGYMPEVDFVVILGKKT